MFRRVLYRSFKRGSLGPHKHGTARVNAALDDQTLALKLQTPAIDIVGFEHLATTDADKAAVAKARALLENPKWSKSAIAAMPEDSDSAPAVTH